MTTAYLENFFINLDLIKKSREVLGPYHDADDGITNGRIYLSLTDSNGENLPGGTWMFKVYGEKVQGTQNYEFNVYY